MAGALVDPTSRRNDAPAEPLPAPDESASGGGKRNNDKEGAGQLTGIEALPLPVGTNRPARRPDTPYPPSARRPQTGPLCTEDAEVVQAAHTLLQLKEKARIEPLVPLLNARLEKLQQEARRRAQSREVDIDGLPRFVFHATADPVNGGPGDKAENTAGRLSAPRSMEDGEIKEGSPVDSDIELVEFEHPTLEGDEDADGDTDEEYMAARAEKRVSEFQVGGPENRGIRSNQEFQESHIGADTSAGGAGKHAITHDYFSYQPTASPDSYSPAPHFPTRPGSLAISRAPTPPPDSPASPTSPDRPASLSPILVDTDVAVLFSDASTSDDFLPATFLRNSPVDPSRPIYLPEQDCRCSLQFGAYSPFLADPRDSWTWNPWARTTWWTLTFSRTQTLLRYTGIGTW
ncbi:hypothetical protein C8R47DRAFT_1068537 [Mycena vitilis]|nr:hypothetical protein C8R47DRAFT_1068537 [Mycena vitilis]